MPLKRDLLRLNSVVPHGVGSSPEAGAIGLIYTYLLQQFSQDKYSWINVNQIGADLDELIMKEGRNIHINIRYAAYEDFESKGIEEKNLIRLDVVHTALVRIAEYDKKLDPLILEEIKSEILRQNFHFDIVLKTFPHKSNTGLVAKLIVCPFIDRFDYYIEIEDAGVRKCRPKVYSGFTTIYYYPFFFQKGRWKKNQLILTGTAKETELKLSLNNCVVEIINLTRYEKSPQFEMMRIDIPKLERDRAYQDWLHSLPPSHAAIISQEPN